LKYFQRNTSVPNLMKIHPQRTKLFHTDKQHNEANSRFFRSFAKAPRKLKQETGASTRNVGTKLATVSKKSMTVFACVINAPCLLIFAPT
jgi:hypothetical protein